MAMSVITGLQGSGKSHQAIKYFVITNYMKGRNIATNISGIKEQELIDYCINAHEEKYASMKASGKPIPPLKLGNLTLISDHQIKQPNFYPTISHVNNKEVIDDKNSVIKSGDVVIIDEAAKFYDDFNKTDLEYFTMHRHFTDSNGLSSEICFLVQDKNLINRKYLKIVKNVYVCKKLDMFGKKAAKFYSLKVYEGSSDRSPVIASSKQAYDKKVFPIYESYAGGKGTEQKLDSRLSLLSNWKLWAFLIALPIIIYLLYSVVGGFFNPKPKEPKQEVNQVSAVNNKPVSPSPSNSSTLDYSEEQSKYKIVGIIDLPTKRLVFLQDENNNMKVVYPQLCYGSGLLMSCQVENKLVSYYSPIRKKNTGENNEKNNTMPSIGIN